MNDTENKAPEVDLPAKSTLEIAIEVIQQIIISAGNISLRQAVTWLEVKENAERLIAETQKGQPDSTDGE